MVQQLVLFYEAIVTLISKPHENQIKKITDQFLLRKRCEISQ